MLLIQAVLAFNFYHSVFFTENMDLDKQLQARNQDFMWGGANEAKVDQTTEMFFLFNFFFNGD